LKSPDKRPSPCRRKSIRSVRGAGRVGRRALPCPGNEQGEPIRPRVRLFHSMITGLLRACVLLPALLPTPELRAQSLANWGLSLSNSLPQAQPGNTLVFSGAIQNYSRSNLYVLGASLSFDASPVSTNWTSMFHTNFLATQLVIKTNGYAGGLFQLNLPNTLPAMFLGAGRFEVALDPRQNFDSLRAGQPTNALTLSIPFFVNLPSLLVGPAPGGVVVSWPVLAGGFVLQSAGNFFPPTGWAAVPLAPFSDGEFYFVTNTVNFSTRYFRLTLP
jgi:hypothetical protein